MAICLRCILDEIAQDKHIQLTELDAVRHNHEDGDTPEFSDDWRIKAAGNPRYGTGDDSQEPVTMNYLPNPDGDHESHMADSNVQDTDIADPGISPDPRIDRLGDTRLTLHPDWSNIHEDDGMDLSVVEPVDDVDVYYDKHDNPNETPDDPDAVQFKVDPRVARIGRGGLHGSMKGVGQPSDIDWGTWHNQFAGDDVPDSDIDQPQFEVDPRIKRITKQKMESNIPKDPDAVDFFLDPRVMALYRAGRQTSKPFQYKDNGSSEDYTG